MSGRAANSHANHKRMETSNCKLASLVTPKLAELEIKFHNKGVVKDDDINGEERSGVRFLEEHSR